MVYCHDKNINFENSLQNIWLKYSQPKFYKTRKTRRPLVSFKLGQNINVLQYNPNFSFDVMSASSC